MTINFEADQQDAMTKTEHIQSLADQVQRLEGLLSRIEKSEDNLKNLKKEYQRISGEVIPTMMSEMGLAELKLQDGSHLKVSTSYRATITEANKEDYILCTGDPAIIGIACSLVSDITNGRYHLLKWDRQEAKYYPITINLYEKGKIDDN